jgi:hypothetical protein
MTVNVFIPTTISVNGYTTHSVIFRGVWGILLKWTLGNYVVRMWFLIWVRIRPMSSVFQNVANNLQIA